MIIVLILILVTGFIFLKTKNKFLNIVIFLLTITLILILLNPKLCISSAHQGVKLFYNSVFPSLFPFTVITGLILSFNGINVYSRIFGKVLCKPLNLPPTASFPLIVSLICGFPLGAKYTGILSKENHLNYDNATTTLIVASNASPLFVIGIVGAVLLKNIKLGYILFFINIISCYITGYIFSSKKAYSFTSLNNIKTTKVNVGNAIKQSIEGALNTSLLVCAYITFFSVIIEYLNHYILNLFPDFNSLIGKMLFGIIEITNGITMISETDTSLLVKLILISFLISFSGLSIFSQVYSLVYNVNLSFKKYFGAKILQGVISSCLISVFILFISITDFSSLMVSTLHKNELKSLSVIYIISYFTLIISFIFSFFAQKKRS
ncbi:sporulation integral membrane protein YlbJ [Oceanirhabdus seepicola]|uniref:Sporulation integral membrane protein YlbJ n=1 Tax=Oceanirhabdus seepicola TaxID=2828781 RepID=A0A9J6P419_9CLOT|nr:sporulation integral membrane protein YlbJ [Oceanirhabdus seepicola]MCM1991076.1 sporulation integral membrane protein YlbJ [Oceanirhabdus seepicola]